MKKEKLSRIAGLSYLVIFFAAIFANFVMLESLKTEPVQTLQNNQLGVRIGIIAFMLTVFFDVVVAWALHLLESKNPLTLLSTLFRMMHASIMGVAVFALVGLLNMSDRTEILSMVDHFNTIWLIGLFFFGAHLILLAQIMNIPKWMAISIMLAGILYMLDTSAHFMMTNYAQYGQLFLLFVAVPSILGEMSLTIWLLNQSRKR